MTCEGEVMCEGEVTCGGEVTCEAVGWAEQALNV